MEDLNTVISSAFVSMPYKLASVQSVFGQEYVCDNHDQNSNNFHPSTFLRELQCLCTLPDL